MYTYEERSYFRISNSCSYICCSLGFFNLPKEKEDTDEEIPKTDSLIEAAKGGGNMHYLGAGALGHKSGIECNSVYINSFENDKSYHCSYLELEFNQAMCFGLSAVKWDDESQCDEFLGYNKEICILNLINKLYERYPQELKGKEICSDISDDVLYEICMPYQAAIKEDYSFCEIEGEYSNYCLYSFLILNKDAEVSNNFCKEFFEDDLKLFNCQRMVSAIEFIEDESRTTVIENIPGVVNREEISENK